MVNFRQFYNSLMRSGSSIQFVHCKLHVFLKHVSTDLLDFP